MKGTIQNKTYTKFEKEDAKLRMGGGSWSVNLDFIDGKDVDRFKIITRERIYEIDRAKAEDVGFIHNFSGEIKLVIPIKDKVGYHWDVTEQAV